MTMTVEPIFGNGWTDGRGDVPEPPTFTIKAERKDDGAISGIITTIGDARLMGARFEATLRHVPSDSLYNCQIELDDGATLAGYCKII